MKTKLALLIATLLISIGCGKEASKNAANSDLKVIKGMWGHLTKYSLAPTNKIVLINFRPGDIFKICMPQYMVDQYPDIKNEYEAAINIWAYYLGRRIPVEFTIKDLPRALKGESLSELRNKYYSECGDNVDMVTGFANLPNDQLGLNAFKLNYIYGEDGKPTPTGGKRILALQEDITDTTKNNIPKNRWLTLSEIYNKELSVNEIIKLFTDRNQVRYTSEFGDKALLPTLVHEIGHVWGLCDQYEGANNCDPENSSLDENSKIYINKNSLMGSGKNKELFFLTDDDITGIRKLAKRDGFDAGWNSDNFFINDTPKEISSKEEIILRLNHLEIDNNNLNIYFTVVATKKRVSYTLKMYIWDDEADKFVSYKTGLTKVNSIELPEKIFAVDLPNNKNFQSVRFELISRNTKGKIVGKVSVEKKIEINNNQNNNSNQIKIKSKEDSVNPPEPNINNSNETPKLFENNPIQLNNENPVETNQNDKTQDSEKINPANTIIDTNLNLV